MIVKSELFLYLYTFSFDINKCIVYSLIYTEATVRESLRKETLVPLGIVHRTMEDTKFRGYDIPKVIVLNFSFLMFFSK